MPKETTRRPTRRELAEKDVQLKIQNTCGQAVPESPELFTLTLEADNVLLEFSGQERYQLVQLKCELAQFCSSLRIIESTITVQKEEQE